MSKAKKNEHEQTLLLLTHQPRNHGPTQKGPVADNSANIGNGVNSGANFNENAQHRRLQRGRKG